MISTLNKEHYNNKVQLQFNLSSKKYFAFFFKSNTTGNWSDFYWWSSSVSSADSLSIINCSIGSNSKLALKF